MKRMVAKWLVVSLVGVLLSNITLLAVLTGLTVRKIPTSQITRHTDSGEQIDDYNTGTASLSVISSVKQELNYLIEFSEASDTTSLMMNIADIYKRQGNLRKPAIHLEMSSTFTTRASVPVLSWSGVSNTTFLGDGAKYQDGMVSVTHGGYYYIYSTVRYTGDGTAELSYGRILHNILMKKASEMEESPTTLTQNLQSTPTIRRGRLAYTTSSLGGTFYLPSDSKIMVTSSIPDNIDMSPFGSNFGLFLV